MTVTILTGASAGIGRDFFRALTANGPKTDEIWLIARREERLRELAATCPTQKVRILPLDLTETESLTALERLLAAETPDVRCLINNAGFGKLGDVAELDWHAQTRMVDLNIRALTALTVLVLPYMTRGACIINMCSIAAFVPNQRMTVYSSTKAYVFSFSTALRGELKPRGIHVLAVCPGPMATEFLPVAGIADGSSVAFDRLPYCQPAKVAETALRKAAKGRAVYTPRGFYKLYRVLAKLLPHNWLMQLSKT